MTIKATLNNVDTGEQLTLIGNEVLVMRLAFGVIV